MKLKTAMLSCLAANTLLSAPICPVVPATAYDRGCTLITNSCPTGNLDILVDGMPLPKYYKRNKVYVEAPWNKDFELRITCPNNGRYLAVCSVDGLSIMNGRPASSQDDGYVIENGRIIIPGFRLNQDNVAHFKFGDKSTSYAKLTGQANNIGVIGLKLFADADSHAYLPSRCYPPRYTYEFEKNGAPGSIGGGGGEGIRCNPGGSQPSPTATNQLQSKDSSDCRKAASGAPNSVCIDNCAPVAQMASPIRGSVSRLNHDMGTEFGARTSYVTQDTHFNRGAVVASFAIEYASHEKLVQAGILPRHDYSSSSSPNPFPNDGCPPPPGWSG